VTGVNFACSGAKTSTGGTGSGDFYCDSSGRQGHALMLQNYAKTHNVREWVNQIRTTSTIAGPYQLQEDGHANYWGQLAMRGCLRLVYNGGAVRGGSCVRVANGLNAQGEPVRGLQ
jgi:hypothetical protein